MLRTESLVGEHLPSVLAKLATSYFTAARRTQKRIAMAGEFESCLALDRSFLVGACLGGHYRLAKDLAHREKYLGFALGAACRVGHRDIIRLLVARGARAWNIALHGACRGGQVDIADWAICCGARDWDLALAGACRAGHAKLVHAMIEYGATALNWGLARACRGGHLQLARDIIARGATNYRWALNAAQGKQHIVRMLLETAQ
jgi:hypothetical protein